jgi:hypothetical protein
MRETVQGPAVATEPIMLRSSVVPTVFADGAVLLDLNTKFFYHVNATGWAIVQLIESTGADMSAILDAARRWGFVPFERDEICRFVEQLVEFDLVEGGDPAVPPDVEIPLRWTTPSIERKAEPLHRLVTSAFDPSIPLAE